VLHDPITRLRIVGFLEGVSYLLLLLVTMPLKYVWGQPQMVGVVGMAHGVLFIAFGAAVLHAAVAGRWSTRRVIAVMAAAVVPAGTFVLDARLRQEQRATTSASTAPAAA
jgi:integral membrane protein